MRPYTPPPTGFVQPRYCEECHDLIGFFPVIGGHKWLHITSGHDHDAVIQPEGYWDTATAEIIHGNPLRRAV